VTAVRERLGPVLGAADSVPESALEDVVVSRLHLPEEREAADLQSRRAAGFGATRELESMVPYAVPQAWARAFDSAGLGGVRYGPRFMPGDASSVALFGDAGSADWAGDPDPLPARELSDVESLPRPRLADLTVVRTPRTRAVRG
jgi:hypothetical protein